MADLPITFSGPMVRAILREIEHPGTGKTQTRRVLKGTRENSIFSGKWADSYVLDPGNASWREQDYRIRVGDRLYVREHWRTWSHLNKMAPREMQATVGIQYVADDPLSPWDSRFRQAMHMPKWASRITLLVNEVRVERLQDCSDADALAEGVVYDEKKGFIVPGVDHPNPDFPYLSRATAREMYAALWDIINGPGAWASNPWVVACTFRPILGRTDQIEKAEHA